MNNYYILFKEANNRLTPASTLTFVLSRKLLDGRLRLPFLCNFRANFAAAMRIGKGTNAG